MPPCCLPVPESPGVATVQSLSPHPHGASPFPLPFHGAQLTDKACAGSSVLCSMWWRLPEAGLGLCADSGRASKSRDVPASLGRDGSSKVQGGSAVSPAFPNSPAREEVQQAWAHTCSTEQTLRRGAEARLVSCPEVTATCALCPLSIPSPSLHAEGMHMYQGADPHLAHSSIFIEKGEVKSLTVIATRSCCSHRDI